MISRMSHTTIYVLNQQEALEFYTQKLGFELRGDTPYGDGDRWVEVAPPGAATRIALVPPREGQSAGVATNIGLTTRDVEADHASLKEQGVDVDDIMRMGDPVPPMFFMRDQDGNTIWVAEETG